MASLAESPPSRKSSLRLVGINWSDFNAETGEKDVQIVPGLRTLTSLHDDAGLDTVGRANHEFADVAEHDRQERLGVCLSEYDCGKR